MTALFKPLALPANVAKWEGKYTLGTRYAPGSLVIDEGWLAISNKETFDRPAPQPTGDAFFDLPDSPAWDADPSSTDDIIAGHEYTFLEPGFLRAIEALAPSLTDVVYRVILLDVTDPENVISYITNNPVLQLAQWSTVNVGNIPFAVGTKLQVLLETSHPQSEGSVDGVWARQANSNNSGPDVGNWRTRGASDVLRVHKTDDTATDRTTELLTVSAGATINITQADDPAKSYQFIATTAPSDQGSYIEWTVNLSEVGALGGPDIDADCDLALGVPVFGLSPYKELAGYWTSNQPFWASVEGLKSIGGVPVTATNDAFGVRLQFQPATISPDWDFTARS